MATTQLTNAEIRSALRAVMALADAIKAAGEVPAGTLYAAAMANGCTLRNFEAMVDLLTRPVDGGAPLVVRRGDVLVWNG